MIHGDADGPEPPPTFELLNGLAGFVGPILQEWRFELVTTTDGQQPVGLAERFEPLKNLAGDHGHLRSGPQIGPHQPRRAIERSVSDRCLGCLHDCLNGSGSPKLRSLLGREGWQLAGIRLVAIPFIRPLLAVLRE